MLMSVGGGVESSLSLAMGRSVNQPSSTSGCGKKHLSSAWVTTNWLPSLTDDLFVGAESSTRCN